MDKFLFFLVFEIILKKLLVLSDDNNLKNVKFNIFISLIIIILSFTKRLKTYAKI